MSEDAEIEAAIEAEIEAEMETAVNEVLGARSLMTEWREAPAVKSVRAMGMLAAARMLICASAAAARAARAAAEEAHDTAEGLDEHGDALLTLAGDLSDQCAGIEADAQSAFAALADEMEPYL